MNLVTTTDALLLDLVERCYWWRRLLHQLKKPLGDDEKEVRLTDLSGEIQKRLKKAVAALERLEAAIRPLREIGGGERN